MYFLKLVDKEDKVLRQEAQKVTEFDNSLATLSKEMAELMYKSDGVGLAAPQVGISKAMVVIDVGEGLMTLVNPEVVYTEGKEVDVEGCLSFPGLYGNVERPDKIVFQAQDLRGRTFRLPASGLLARAVQHEIDHLHGVLFVDKADLDITEDDLKKKKDSKKDKKKKKNKNKKDEK